MAKPTIFHRNIVYIVEGDPMKQFTTEDFKNI